MGVAFYQEFDIMLVQMEKQCHRGIHDVSIEKLQQMIDLCKKEIKNRMKEIEEYWITFYADTGHCSLCGNRGIVDTRGVTTPAGLECGRLNYCICPNGQKLRENKIDMEAALDGE